MFIPRIDDEVNVIFGFDNHSSTPERRLLAALLERAILDFVGNETSEVKAAEEWLFDWQSDESESENSGESEDKFIPFSFRWICHQLDLNPHKVAGFIKAMPKRGDHRVAPWYFNKRVEMDERKCASIR